MYKSFFKRFFDLIISLVAVILLSPIFLLLSILGFIIMKGNPFFAQKRPGKNEKIFHILKFRTMSNRRDKNGELLPDEQRLNKYGRFLRSTSLDELPQLLNVISGSISLCGPRALAVCYLPYYTDAERHRHDVRPGITGLAQVNGRNNLSWEEKFTYDLEYVNNVSLKMDIYILFKTFKKVFVREGIGQGNDIPVSLHVEREGIKIYTESSS